MALWRIKHETLLASGEPAVATQDVRHTRRGAVRAFYHAVQDALSVSAGRDTTWGWRAYYKADRLERDILTGVNKSGGSVSGNGWRVAIGREG